MKKRRAILYPSSNALICVFFAVTSTLLAMTVEALPKANLNNVNGDDDKDALTTPPPLLRRRAKATTKYSPTSTRTTSRRPPPSTPSRRSSRTISRRDSA